MLERINHNVLLLEICGMLQQYTFVICPLSLRKYKPVSLLSCHTYRITEIRLLTLTIKASVIIGFKMFLPFVFKHAWVLFTLLKP